MKTNFELNEQWTKVEDLTQAQQTIVKSYLSNGLTLNDIDTVHMVVKKSTDEILHVSYKELKSLEQLKVEAEEATKPRKDLLSGLNLMYSNKHSKAYQSAKKRTSLSDREIEASRNLVNRGEA